MKKLNAEELSTGNLAVELGLCEMDVKKQAEFFVDYVLTLEGVLSDEFQQAGIAYQDVLFLANNVKDIVDAKERA